MLTLLSYSSIHPSSKVSFFFFFNHIQSVLVHLEVDDTNCDAPLQYKKGTIFEFERNILVPLIHNNHTPTNTNPKIYGASTNPKIYGYDMFVIPIPP